MTSKKRDVSNIVLEQATISVRLTNLREIVEAAAHAKFPEASEIYVEGLDPNRIYEGMLSLDDFWVAAEVTVTE